MTFAWQGSPFLPLHLFICRGTTWHAPPSWPCAPISRELVRPANTKSIPTSWFARQRDIQRAPCRIFLLRDTGDLEFLDPDETSSNFCSRHSTSIDGQAPAVDS